MVLVQSLSALIWMCAMLPNSGKMFPVFTINNTPHSTFCALFVDPSNLSETHSQVVKSPDGFNFFGSEYMPANFLSLWRKMPSLRYAISIIVQICSQPQMIGIAASAIIAIRAIVANIHAVWDFAIGYNPRRTMGKNAPSLEIKPSVTIGPDLGYPGPAFIGATLINFVPKGIGKGCKTSGVAVKKFIRLPLNTFSANAGLFGDSRLLSTSTMTIPKRDFQWGNFRSILVHVDAFLTKVLTTPLGVCRAAGVICCAHYTMKDGVNQCLQ